jgi:hypothetical protein
MKLLLLFFLPLIVRPFLLTLDSVINVILILNKYLSMPIETQMQLSNITSNNDRHRRLYKCTVPIGRLVDSAQFKC